MSESRWQLRFDKYRAALALVEAAVAERARRPLNELEQAGFIQRFEFTWEQGWKTMGDYLRASGVTPTPYAPANVLRAAHQANLIADGDEWFAAMRGRNEMSHNYDSAAAAAIIDAIACRFCR